MLMELYAAEGRRSDALRQYRSCREIMRRELGVDPDRETLALAERIKTRAVAPPAAPALAEEPVPVQAPAGAPSARLEHTLSEPAEAEIAGDENKPPAENAILTPARLGKKPRRWSLWGGLCAAAGALCLAIFGGVWTIFSDHPLLNEDGPSIVVMPFHAFGENRQIKFGESIADGLGKKLSQLPGARIVSPETARAYATLGAQQARRELGVAYIVEGSVFSAPPETHTEAKLIETQNDTVASTFAADVAEADPGRVRVSVLAGLTVPLIRAVVQHEAGRASQKAEAAQTANDLVWLGWWAAYQNPPSYESSVEALHFLERALKLDKNNVDALALTANVLLIQGNYRERIDFHANLSTADTLLDKALILQPQHVLARFSRCVLRRSQGRYEEALAVCRGLVDDPYRGAWAYKEIGWAYLFLGKADDAIAAFSAADRLAKDAAVRWAWLFGADCAHLQAGNYEQAIEWLHRAMAVRPRQYSVRVWLVAAYALSGRQQDAAAEMAELRRAKPDLFSRDDALAEMVELPGSPAFGEYMHSAVEGLEKAGFPERITKPLLAKTLIPGPNP